MEEEQIDGRRTNRLKKNRQMGEEQIDGRGTD